MDIDRLKEQVKDSDCNKFDKLVSHSRENINTSLKNFNGTFITVHDSVSDVLSYLYFDYAISKKRKQDYDEH